MDIRSVIAIATLLGTGTPLAPTPDPRINADVSGFATAWTTVGPRLGSQYGGNVVPAGDVNGDGFGDVLVSAQNDSVAFPNEGRVFLYLGSAQGLSLVPVWTWRANQQEAGTGGSIASAGDVNADGYFDVLVGVETWTAPNLVASGKVAVFHGSPSGLPATPTYELTGPSPAVLRFYGQVATAGDVNGDGYSDAIIGASGYSDGVLANRGAVYVHLGGPAGLAATPARTLLGDQGNAGFGLGVATAGDVNADGFDDILIGAPYRSSGGLTNNGAAWLFFGSAGGVLAVADTILVGTRSEARCGTAVATAGDYTGDGYADVIIGQPGYDDGVVQGGRADLWFGGPSGLYSSQFMIGGGAPGCRAGTSVATVGDLDADGYSDVAVGVPDFLPPGGPGRVHVFRGDPDGGFTLGVIMGDPELSRTFGSSVAASGDVNGDGFSEILIGDPLGGGLNAAQFGSAFLITLNPRPLSFATGWPKDANEVGSRAGSSLAILPQHDNGSFPQLVIGSPHLNGRGAFEFHRGRKGGANPVAERGGYAGSNTALGTCVVDAGDVNRDGFSDLLVSMPQLPTAAGSEAGYVELYVGAPGAQNNGTPALIGDQAFAWIGTALAGRGDVNGDGYHDYLIASSRWSGPGRAGCGKVWLCYGGAAAPLAPGWSVEGTAVLQGLGAGVAFGDLDADGYSDVVIGSSTPSDAPTPANGKVEVYYGGPGGVAAVPGLALKGNPSSPSYGSAVASVGDVNGDGLCDLGVGAPDEGTTGRVYVHAGTLGRSQTNAVIWSKAGTQAGGRFGQAFTGGGDMTGDGIADLAIGEPGWDNGNTDEGRFLVYRGGVDGPSPTPDWNVELHITGAELGAAFAPLADLDLDGLADLVVGAPGATGRTCLFTPAGPKGGLSNRLRLLEDAVGSPRRFHPTRLDSPNLLSGGMILRSAAGRARVAVRIERRTQNTPFTGVPTNITGFVDSGTPGFPNELFPTITLPWPGRGYHVRGRLVSNSPFFQRSRWVTPEAHASGDIDVWSNGVVVDVEDSRKAVGVARLEAATPNPSSAAQGGATRIAFTLARPGEVTLDVLDVRGVRVRRLLAGVRPPGATSLLWDGRDETGRAAGAGVYFVLLRAGAESDRRKIVRLP